MGDVGVDVGGSDCVVFWRGGLEGTCEGKVLFGSF